ncbi:hypothetical protein V2A60_003893 [Cordyceps javanica]
MANPTRSMPVCFRPQKLSQVAAPSQVVVYPVRSSKAEYYPPDSFLNDGQVPHNRTGNANEF